MGLLPLPVTLSMLIACGPVVQAACLRIMENKGFVRHTARGRSFVFEPLVTKDEVDQRSVEALLAQNFGGSARGLFVNLLESDAVAEEEIAELEQMIQEYRKRKSRTAEI